MLKIGQGLAGKQATCPNCKQKLSVPANIEALPVLVPLASATKVSTAGSLNPHNPGQSAAGGGHDGQGQAKHARHAEPSGLVARVRQRLEIRKLRSEIHDLEIALEQKLRRVGNSTLEAQDPTLELSEERSHIERIAESMDQREQRLQTLRLAKVPSSVTRDLELELESLYRDRDAIVVAVGRKACAALPTTHAAVTEVAHLDEVLKARRSCLAQLTATDAQHVGLHGEFRDAHRPTKLALVAVLLLGLFSAGWFSYASVAARYAPIAGRPDRTLTPAKGGVIASIKDEETIAQAVGYVVCGFRITFADGTRAEIPSSIGSSFAVSSDGYLLTNKHVVEETAKLMNAKLLLQQFKEERLWDVRPTVWVFFKTEKYTAEVLHISDRFDLAVLKVDRPSGPYFRISASERAARGTDVFALGFPDAGRVALSEEELVDIAAAQEKQPEAVEDAFQTRDFEFVQTNGAVSRPIEEEEGRKWIQHNAEINPGNSGGPLVGQEGVVVGINTRYNPDAKGIFWSLPLAQMKDEIEEHVAEIQWE